MRSEERTRSPRICATAVPLVEHLDLERKDLKRKENLRMAVQRCKEQRETIRSLRVHNNKLKDENIQLRRTKTEEGYEERVTELREAYDKNLREGYEERVRSLIERNRRIIEAYEEENSQLREGIIQLYRQLPDDPNVHTPEEQLVARLIESFGILQHDEEDERWEQPYDPADDAAEIR